MIVKQQSAGTTVTGPAGAEVSWSCLARRGMLHSECEGIDLLTLAAGARLDERGRDGIAEAYFVLSGEAELGDGTRLAAGQLLLITPDDPERPVLRASTALELLTISVLTRDTTDLLPNRAPEMTA